MNFIFQTKGIANVFKKIWEKLLLNASEELTMKYNVHFYFVNLRVISLGMMKSILICYFQVKADVTEGSVRLADAIGNDSDAVICATGFRRSLDFLAPWKVSCYLPILFYF